MVSVIVVNYNGAQDTRRCVASVKQHAPESEIIVVDSHSTDGSVETLSREFPETLLVGLDVNRGYGYACNRGARAAHGEYLFFLNNDAYLAEDALSPLVDSFGVNPRVGVCAPKVVYPGGMFQLSFGSDPSIIQEWKERGRQRRLKRHEPGYAEKLGRRLGTERRVDWVSGVALMVRRDLFEAVDGFDAEFFMYFEDCDLCRRIRSLGFEIHFNPSVSVVHRVGASGDHHKARIMVEYRKSQMRYYRKHRSMASRTLLRAYVFFRLLPYVLVAKVSSRRDVHNILVIKLCCIGDVVFLTPVLRSIRERFPGAHLTYLASSWIKDLIDRIPQVDETITFDAPFWKGRWWEKSLSTLRLLAELRRRKFDMAVIGHRNATFSFVAYLAGIPLRVGFASGGRFYFLTHPVDFNPERHEIKRYADLAAAVGISTDNLNTQISPVDELGESVSGLFTNLGIRGGDLVVGIIAGGGSNPGSRMPIKRWDMASYASLCRRILLSDSTKILLLGGKEDWSLNEELAASIPSSRGRVHNVAGTVSLRDLPSLLHHCQIVLGGDSGPTHIAAAVGTQTIFLFGPSDPRLVAPMGANVRYIWKQVHCSPCYTPLTVMERKYFKGNTFVCWTGTHECMTMLTVDEVFQEFVKVASDMGWVSFEGKSVKDSRS